MWGPYWVKYLVKEIIRNFWYSFLWCDEDKETNMGQKLNKTVRPMRDSDLLMPTFLQNEPQFQD